MNKKLIAISVGLLVILIGVLPVEAQGPTPTYPPVRPSPTSYTEHLRPTPTMFPMGDPTPFIDITGGDKAGQIADNAINMYHSFNRSHVFDYIIFAFIILLVLSYLSSILGSSTKIK